MTRTFEQDGERQKILKGTGFWSSLDEVEEVEGGGQLRSLTPCYDVRCWYILVCFFSIETASSFLSGGVIEVRCCCLEDRNQRNRNNEQSKTRVHLLVSSLFSLHSGPISSASAQLLISLRIGRITSSRRKLKSLASLRLVSCWLMIWKLSLCSMRRESDAKSDPGSPRNVVFNREGNSKVNRFPSTNCSIPE